MQRQGVGGYASRPVGREVREHQVVEVDPEAISMADELPQEELDPAAPEAWCSASLFVISCYSRGEASSKLEFQARKLGEGFFREGCARRLVP